jgi:hypothetical protein
MVSSSNARNSLDRSGKACGIAACLLGLLSAPGLSFAQGVQDVCPRGYSIFQTVCLNEATGDVVNQSRRSEAGGIPSPVSNPDKAPAPAKSGG